MKLLFFILLVNVSLNLFSQQKRDYNIYIGKITGITKDSFIKENEGYRNFDDSVLNLMPITSSVFPIEIRMYENKSAQAATVCTILFFNDSFYLKRYAKIYNGWEGMYKPEFRQPVEYINAYSAFNRFVENGLFYMQENDYSYNHDSTRLILTKDGLIPYLPLCGVMDGNRYYLQIKVGKVFKELNFSSNEESQLHCYPDIEIIRRKKNIVSQLEANIRFVNK